MQIAIETHGRLLARSFCVVLDLPLILLPLALASTRTKTHIYFVSVRRLYLPYKLSIDFPIAICNAKNSAHFRKRAHLVSVLIQCLLALHAMHPIPKRNLRVLPYPCVFVVVEPMWMGRQRANCKRCVCECVFLLLRTVLCVRASDEKLCFVAGLGRLGSQSTQKHTLTCTQK